MVCVLAFPSPPPPIIHDVFLFTYLVRDVFLSSFSACLSVSLVTAQYGHGGVFLCRLDLVEGDVDA